MPSDTDLAYLHAGAASVSRIGRRTKSAFGVPWIRMTMLVADRRGLRSALKVASEHANQRISMRAHIALYSAFPGRLPRCSQHESPGRVRGPIPPQRRRSVPIAYENRLVVPDILGTTIKLTSSASRRGPLA